MLGPDVNVDLGWGLLKLCWLTHWGRVTHICTGNLTIIGSHNGLSPGCRETIIWSSAGILLTGPLGTNFSNILIEIHTFSFKQRHLKISSRKWRPCCLGLNVLTSSSPSGMSLQQGPLIPQDGFQYTTIGLWLPKLKFQILDPNHQRNINDH